MLKHQMGLSFSKTSEALKELSDITISPGGLAQAYQRVAGKVEGDYEALKERLLASQSVHTDETSWWVGGPKASLWVFCNRQGTYYRVVESKNRDTFYEVIPPEWKGVLVSDCLSVYDNATELRSGWEQRAPPQQEETLRSLKLAAQALLGTERTDRPQEEAVRMRLQRQIKHLFVFLEKPGVEATNNLAERQLRPAVIARKISCGQRTWKGAQSWQVLASLAASARQTGQSFTDLVASHCSFSARSQVTSHRLLDCSEFESQCFCLSFELFE
jgi:hypothetical protein